MKEKSKTVDQKNTYVFDLNNPAELARLIDQDRFLNQTMGGPLAGVPNLPEGARVLDMGCGPGGWVLDAAFERPDIEIAGIDISPAMINYANARARSQGRFNATFGVMNIIEPLDFSDASFDLVNARLLVGTMKREAWDVFLDECTRILRPGGILRLSEPEDGGLTNAATFEFLNELSIKAFWKRGYGFSVDGRTFGMGPALLQKLKQRGYQTRLGSFIGDYSRDSPGWADYYHNAEITTPQLKPLLMEEGKLTLEEFDQLYFRELAEMSREDFSATWRFVVICGVRSTE